MSEPGDRSEHESDHEPAEVAKVQKKLEGARVKLARQESHLGDDKQP